MYETRNETNCRLTRFRERRRLDPNTAQLDNAGADKGRQEVTNCLEDHAVVSRIVLDVGFICPLTRC